ncbi:MAG: two-component regulator propeller domain-containing protein [Bacteroidota bacterium]
MMTNLRLLFLLVFVLQGTVLFGQSPYFQQYFLLRKNDAVQVESILKDQKGFMWVGTNKGLFRFDGINIKRFTKADSLAIDHVTALAQDSLGRIWIGHKNGQLSVMEKDVIRKMQFPEGDATQEISDILFGRDGTMWFSTLNDGLYYFHEHLYRLDEADGMPDVFVYDLEESFDGSIWAGTDRGAAVVSLDGHKASIKVLDYKTGFPDNIIKKIVKGNDGALWLATEDAGIFSYDIASGKTTPLTKSPWSAGGIIDFLKLDNQFWIATSSASVAVYDQSDDQLNIYNPVPGLTPTALFADEEGSVWIGARNGLFRSLGRAVRFIDDLWPSHDVNAAAVTVDHNNNIWFSNDEGLFKRSLDKEGKIKAQRYLDTAPYSKFTVISLFTDCKGFVWAGFYGQGAVRINPDDGQMTRFDKELSNGNVLSISGTENKVWLSTLSGATLIDLTNGMKVTNYDRSKGLDCDYVYQVFVDSKGRTWFASDREGVAMLDEHGGSFHKILGNLTAKAVYGFAEDSTGAIWANVQDDGLYKFDGQQFQPGQTLRNINVNCLSSDIHGNLIAVHDLGIEVYNPATNSIHHLDNEIGFGDRKPNLNSVAKDEHGGIYVGTDHGIVIYGQANASQARPKVAIDKFRVFNKYKDWSNGFKLAYDENNVTITFLGFWYQDPQGIGFQYRLDNYDLDWISTGDRSAVFSSLPPGSYTFRVRASADGSFENATEDVVSFEIRPPFWQTIPFYIFVGVAIATMAYMYMRARERNLMREKIELEEKVAERTAEITKKNEEILAQAEEIKAINESLEKRVAERTFELERKNKALEDYAFINAHNLRSPRSEHSRSDQSFGAREGRK